MSQARDAACVGTLAEQITAVRSALVNPRVSALATRTVTWHWDLATGSVEWDARLPALFGHAETLTDAAWREERIHPDDRERVKLSLQRATIVNHGAVWSSQYRFRHADGSYTTVTERAYVIADSAGPRSVVGAITPTAAGPGAGRIRSPANRPLRVPR